MKIRDRLTWLLSITAVAAIATVGILVYIFTSRFHEREFFNRLEKRVALTELIFLEKNQAIEQAVRDKFLQTLDAEKEFAITLHPSGIDSLHRLFPEGLAGRIKQEEVVKFWQGERQGVGRLYHLPAGDYAVIVTAVDTFGRSKLNFLRKILLIGGVTAVLLLVVVDRLGIAAALRPLEDKIHRASDISADRLDLRLEVNNPDDEIGEVAIAFNRMLDRLQASFEAQRQFVRNASHEMRNPLTAISGQIEVLLGKTRSPEEYQATLQIIQAEADRLQLLMRQLLDLEKTEALSQLPEPKVFPLDQCLLEAIEPFPPQRIQLDLALDDGQHNVKGSFPLLRTALQNIVDNALKYSSDQPVKVSCHRRGQCFEIMVEDRGIGIPQADLEQIFQPLFRSSNARRKQGHGIGLTLVKKIADLHNGTLKIASETGEGTTVTLRLPTF